MWGGLTLFGQDSNADARVAQFDEGRISGPPVVLSDQEDVFSAHVAVDKVLLFLDAGGGHSQAPV